MKLWPPFYALSGSSAEIFGVKVYGNDNRPFWVRPVHKWARKAQTALWEVRYRFQPKHRYHVVQTGLKPGYYDVDTIMLHACMALMCRYVEKEHDGVEALEKFAHEIATDIDPNGPEGVQIAQAQKDFTVVEIYKWWKITRPADQARREVLLNKFYGSGRRSLMLDPETKRLKLTPAEELEYREFRDLEQKIETDEDKMLARLVEIRGGLWT